MKKPVGGMSMFERQQVLDVNEEKGRFSKERESQLVGAGAKYPASAGPWSANNPQPGPEPFIDGRYPAPRVGMPFEEERADRLAALRKERNRCVLEQKLIDPADPAVDEWQAKRELCEAEIAELERS